MKRFVVNAITDADTNPFDRQQRIAWWRQDKIAQARVMVVGAGAIGNETLKNLALLGFRNIFIVDFDTIATSNLSRTVLFRREDKGKIKSETAALRTRELCLTDDPRIDWFHGDVVWELGAGVFRQMDLVLGCLDNAETRFFINRQCWLAQTPWIDAGIFELSGAVSVYVPGVSACYRCLFGAPPEDGSLPSCQEAGVLGSLAGNHATGGSGGSKGGGPLASLPVLGALGGASSGNAAGSNGGAPGSSTGASGLLAPVTGLLNGLTGAASPGGGLLAPLSGLAGKK